MNWQEKNNDVYNKSATKIAEYFTGYGARTEEINEVDMRQTYYIANALYN